MVDIPLFRAFDQTNYQFVKRFLKKQRMGRHRELAFSTATSSGCEKT